MKIKMNKFIILIICFSLISCASVQSEPSKREKPVAVYIGRSKRTGSICVVLEYIDGSKENYCPNDSE